MVRRRDNLPFPLSCTIQNINQESGPQHELCDWFEEVIFCCQQCRPFPPALLEEGEVFLLLTLRTGIELGMPSGQLAQLLAIFTNCLLAQDGGSGPVRKVVVRLNDLELPRGALLSFLSSFLFSWRHRTPALLFYLWRIEQQGRTLLLVAPSVIPLVDIGRSY